MAKTLFVVDEFWPVESAPAVRIHSLLKAFQPEECDVLAGVFENPAPTPQEWFLIKRSRSGRPLGILAFLLKMIWRLVTLAGSGRYKAVVISVPKYELLLSVPFLKKLPVKTVIDVRDTLEFVDYDSYFSRFMPRLIGKIPGYAARKISGFLRKGAFRYADLVTAANPAIAQALKELNSNVKLVSNGVDTDHFSPKPGQGKSLSPLELVYMGNFVEKDDFSLLAETLPPFGEKVRVNLIGEGRHKANIIKILGSRIPLRDLGRVPHKDIPSVLQGMHIGFIFRSQDISASIPVALYEFSSMNIPVLCNDTGIMGEFVRKHSLGWVIKNARELSSLLERVIAGPSEMRSFGNLHETAEKNFSRRAAALYFKQSLENLLKPEV